jgi:hypothetical protein
VILLLACRSPETNPPRSTDPASTSDTTPTTTDWGVTDTCSDKQRGGFDALYDSGSAILVYGDSDADEDFAHQVYDWYAPNLALELRRGSELTPDERAQNLMVVGSPDTNPLLTELDDALAVRFDPGSFEFGGYTYDEPGNGIALISPNPEGQDTWVVLYAGNTFDGAYSTFTIWTGAYDYETTRGRGIVAQEGDLCHDDWRWYRRYDDDQRKAWDKWVGKLEVATTDHHQFQFEAGSDADHDRGWFPDWQEDQYAHALSLLDVDGLDFPIRTYLYTTRDQKLEETGDSGNAFANDLNYEVHALYGEGVYAVGAHEDVHVIAWHRIGAANSALLGEGLAVWVDGIWWDQPLDDWAAYYRDAGEIPPLSELIARWSAYDDAMTYPLAGDFVGFLVDGWGMDATKRIYAAPDLEDALLAETGFDLAGIEAAWLASIP